MRKITITYMYGDSGVPGSKSVFVPDDAVVVRVQIEKPLPTDRDVIRVLLPGSRTQYHYLCPDAQLGDYVCVPPTHSEAAPQVVEVIGKGRRNFTGRLLKATLIRKGAW